MPPLDAARVRRLLHRIDLSPPTRADLRGLAALQRAFLHRVPFENLDIALGRRIVLEPDAIYDKIVHRRRGGYCYEVNSLFARLLAALGYRVELVAARVWGADGPGDDFDHLAVVVTLDGETRPMLVDVGFGDAFARPLPLDGRWRRDGRKRVRVVRRDGRWCYEEDGGEGAHVGYDFTEVARSLDEFAPRNDWQQTSPDSHFTAGSVCSILTLTHRFTISGPGLGRRLVTTDLATGERSERRLSETEATAALLELFGVDVSAPP